MRRAWTAVWADELTIPFLVVTVAGFAAIGFTSAVTTASPHQFVIGVVIGIVVAALEIVFAIQQVYRTPTFEPRLRTSARRDLSVTTRWRRDSA